MQMNSGLILKPDSNVILGKLMGSVPAPRHPQKQFGSERVTLLRERGVFVMSEANSHEVDWLFFPSQQIRESACLIPEPKWVGVHNEFPNLPASEMKQQLSCRLSLTIPDNVEVAEMALFLDWLSAREDLEKLER
jgi:hypothetical protein